MRNLYVLLQFFLGEGFVAFDDLSVESISLNNIMTIECFGNNTSTSVKATSQLFHVYDAPTTGLLNEISNTFHYKGKMEYIMPVLLAYDNNMGTISCNGCPAGTVIFIRLKKISCFLYFLGSVGRKARGDNFNICWSPLKQC